MPSSQMSGRRRGASGRPRAWRVLALVSLAACGAGEGPSSPVTPAPPSSSGSARVGPASARATLLRPRAAAPFHLALDGTAPLPPHLSAPDAGDDGIPWALVDPCVGLPVRASCLAWLVLEADVVAMAPVRIEVALEGRVLEAREIPAGVTHLEVPIPQGLAGTEDRLLDLTVQGGTVAVSRLDVATEGFEPRAVPGLSATSTLVAELVVRPDRTLAIERPRSWGDASVELLLDAADRRSRRLLPADLPLWRMDLRAFAYRRTRLELRMAAPSCADTRILEPPVVRLEPRESPEHPSVVLMSLDTLRVDLLGAYGAPEMATPRLDALLRGARLHPDAHSSSHWTLPAHATLFLATPADVHGAGERRAPPRWLGSLTEALWDAGYQTAGYVNHVGWLSPKYGFDRGFDHYLVSQDNSWARARRVAWYLGAHRRGPRFVFVHFYEAHSDFERAPYEAPRENLALWAPSRGRFPRISPPASEALTRANLSGRRFAPAAEEALGQMYVAGLAELDEAVARMARTFRRGGMWDDALVVLVSDHGEEMAEHGRYLHDQVYDEVTRTLLAFRVPGEQGAVVPGLATLADVAPTILSLAGVPVRPATWRGRDLRAGAPPFAYAVSSHDVAVLRTADRTILRDASGALSLFDRAADPGERHPLAIAPAEEADLRRVLEASRSAAGPRETAGPAVELSPEERERLKALGYLQ